MRKLAPAKVLTGSAASAVQFAVTARRSPSKMANKLQIEPLADNGPNLVRDQLHVA